MLPYVLSVKEGGLMPLIGYLCFYICERKALESCRLYERRGSTIYLTHTLSTM